MLLLVIHSDYLIISDDVDTDVKEKTINKLYVLYMYNEYLVNSGAKKSM